MYRVDLGKKLLDKEYNPFISLAAQYRSDEADKNGRNGFNLGDIYYLSLIHISEPTRRS